MSDIYQFPIINLRQEIRNGYISEGTEELIRKILIKLNVNFPNSWDKNFCDDMLVYRGKLSDKQSAQLERILDNLLMEMEPSGSNEIEF